MMIFTIINPELRFTGDVSEVSRQGSKMTARCKLGSSLFDTSLPVLLKGTSCSHLRGSPGDGSHLISQGCTGPDAIMTKSKWKFTGLVVNPISDAFPFAIKLGTVTGVGASAAAALAASAVFADWFAFGYMEWGTLENVQRRLVIGSTAPVAGVVTLTIKRYLSALPALNDVVTFYPGCPGTFAACKAHDAATNPGGKFGNDVNFGADPFTPTSNPSTTNQQNLGTQGGKK